MPTAKNYPNDSCIVAAGILFPRSSCLKFKSIVLLLLSTTICSAVL